MLDHRLRRWSSIKTTLVQQPVFSEITQCGDVSSYLTEFYGHF